MIRRIIQIDSEKCNGCGLCAGACHEGAIGMVNGKAILIKDDYCDGLGDCLPACPVNAISFVEREAAAYDEAAVKARMGAKKAEVFSGCPGSRMKTLNNTAMADTDTKDEAGEIHSRLRQWPVQIKLAPVNAPFFDGADILIAADCTAYAYGDFHREFMNGKVTLIGCPKLDSIDYSEKLTAILASNDIKSVTVTRMEVPCCGGIEHAVRAAVLASGKKIPLNVVTIGINGKIL